MSIVVYFSTIVITTILLVWWRTCCEWHGYHTTHFPTKGHIVLLVAASFIPIWNIVQFCVMILLYLALRLTDELNLKSNRFTRKWFDVK